MDKKIYRNRRNFFLENIEHNKAVPMVSWDKIFRPKKVGGLGLLKIEAINDSFFLSKLT